MNYALNTGCGDFLNAEGAKVSQRAQKKMEKRIPKNSENIFLRNFPMLNFVFSFDFSFVFLLRSLRNLRALCVQKLPSFSPSSLRAASPL
jgi:hypothetical protein